MSRLETTFMDTLLKNPVVVASGTYGYGEEYVDYYNPALLGGVCSKGITRYPKLGNDGIRLWETPSGLLNSIGLENPGIETFIEKHLKKMNLLNTAVIVNVGGNTIDEYLESVELLNDCNIDFIELNISCPNVKVGGMAFGIKAKSAAKVVSKVTNISKHKIMVKLSPNAENIVEMAKACEDNGADGLSLVNTFQGMAIDIHKKKAAFDNLYAGLSGPAIKPIALRMVHQVYKNVNIPIMGLGGISTWQDALEFIMAGATAIQIGTANFINPMTPIEIIRGLEEYCVKNDVESVGELVGIV
ncbi:dihydroorotate dehydrogenase [Alkalibaculum bacchi]|uniref:dihydroorotate dehydrogenase n=1 Tax=Alkalibaculum bacchi TaxID=645887 RepID=UPI0026E96997|nr:dihydroorotate dehydrogenase [Alkalibaculum bacchi]